jgi:4-hydroxy-tetrahydrodipicolinate reductase
VVGAGGRMGQEVCHAVASAPDLDLAAAVDPAHAGAPLTGLIGSDGRGLTIAERPEALSTAGVDVVVDFTRVDAARANLAFCADRGIHAVVGTTGFAADDLAELSARFGPDDAPNCIVAPNFAIGAVLMMKFAAMAAPWFEATEIIELHHGGKIDAPSGTALATASRMAEARSAARTEEFAPDATKTVMLEGARGATGPAGVRIHSVRLPGLVAHQEVILGATGQTLIIRHDSTDRRSFMDGVLLAVRRVSTLPGLTVGLDTLLEL